MRLFGSSSAERRGFALYGACVRAARAPAFFLDGQVPDTLDGRFDLVSLYVALMIRRLRREGREGAALAQAVFDAMFADMDVSLREIGVGDLAVGKKVRAMWEAFHGRALAYQAPLDAGDAAGLAAALARNVWRGAAPAGAAALLADRVLVEAARLDAVPAATLLAGEATFPAPLAAA